MKPRAALTAAEVTALHADLERRLESIGLTSQPEIALRMLALASDARSEVHDWAKVIRTDPATAARVLRLANSAYFAQRKPVTSVDRACLVLGLERLKAVALGFHLTRAAGVPGVEGVSRNVWGQSVFRACLACETSRVIAPALVAEAFVIGLMLDAGIPLMARLLGEPYVALFSSCPCPASLYRREFDELPFTHIDTVAAMARRWRLPELISKPLEWHHTRPSQLAHTEPPQRLHRIAFVAGLVELSIDTDAPTPPRDAALSGIPAGQRVLAVSNDELTRIVEGARTEYSATIEMFSDIAQRVANVDALGDAVHVALTKAVDATIETSLRSEENTAADRLMIGQSSIELHREPDGAAVAFLFDSRGQRLLAHRFRTSEETALSLCEALGIDRPTGDVLARVQDALRRLAA